MKPSSWARAFVSSAPVVFTGGWLWSGARTPDISHSRRSISALGSVGQPFPAPTLIGQGVQGVAQLVNADLARRSGLRALSAALATSGAATIVATATPLTDTTLTGQEQGWVHRVHTIAGGAGMVAFHLAPLIGAADQRLAPRTRRLGLGAFALALPATGYFTHHLARRGNDGPAYGLAERFFLSVLLAWSTVAPRGYPASGHRGYPASGHRGYPASGHRGYPASGHRGYPRH